MQCFDCFMLVVKLVFKFGDSEEKGIIECLDVVLMYCFFGLFIFFGLMLLVFQVIFVWVGMFMEWIEIFFIFVGDQVWEILFVGWFIDLLMDGIIVGLGGVLVFILQIIILFLFIVILEEVGYMAWVVFMFDQVM